jgi:hypothetical protein
VHELFQERSCERQLRPSIGFRPVSVAFKSCAREVRRLGPIYALQWFTRRFYLRYLQAGLRSLPQSTAQDLERRITVVIPAAEKDAPVLSHCLRAECEMVQNPRARLLVVAPASALIQQIATAGGAEFVEESAFLPRPPRELNTRGWVLQQLIKFNASFLVSTDDYLVLDADTVFLRQQAFFRGGRTVLRFSDQYELLYDDSLRLLLGTSRRFPVSFVTHHMVFNRDLVRSLLASWENRFGRPWWQVLLREVDDRRRHLISFSEYELYGNYVVASPDWQSRFLLEYWSGKNLCAQDLHLLEDLRGRAGDGLNSVSFHWHTQ